jgi:hypothetical protein
VHHVLANDSNLLFFSALDIWVLVPASSELSRKHHIVFEKAAPDAPEELLTNAMQLVEKPQTTSRIGAIEDVRSKDALRRFRNDLGTMWSRQRAGIEEPYATVAYLYEVCLILLKFRYTISSVLQESVGA